MRRGFCFVAVALVEVLRQVGPAGEKHEVIGGFGALPEEIGAQGIKLQKMIGDGQADQVGDDRAVKGGIRPAASGGRDLYRRRVAQGLEHLLDMQGVGGSIPLAPTIFPPRPVFQGAPVC